MIRRLISITTNPRKLGLGTGQALGGGAPPMQPSLGQVARDRYVAQNRFRQRAQ